ncbi:gamma-glutamyltransferase [Caulobacter vibrioides]|uniref:Glutathione hydrolase proenzyme n=1 Tax=Caulobacter vibrioides (strain NA1000 / CB15N) TaxID=565050 RepID=A0A0H3C2R7_CAUVN|nr:gamma-glutamyltransferase [Caulobacter vibrioides]YP_002515478.1 gamma-glutamyltranspeptidase [Caulobacter vibrioides NA1000]ACL93570.1 gamma-glutamyltranspeptidase [Caulobacter vibrioides NA1000]QXZ52199.1 gamma-glutamyltransferase [Caulobacter vibrioides]
MRLFAPLAAALSAALLLVAPSVEAKPRSAAAAVRALEAGAVASPDQYGALAAQEVLKAGGNAVDAAVATGFALAVTYPEAGNLGGGGFMTVYMDGKPYFLDYRETAPAAARADMYLGPDGELVEGLSLYGGLAAGVPGTVRGLAMAHQRFGKLPWGQVLAPAIRYARDGFVVDAHLAGVLADEPPPEFAKTNFRTYFAAHKAGTLFKQPELAATLERIALVGDRAFYEGKTADLIVAQMARGPVKGLITKADLSTYKAAWRTPLVAKWRGYDVITAPPPSSGGIALMQLLLMKQNLAPMFQGVALNDPQYVHLLAEIEKRVYADRAEYLGDPDFVKVPVSNLIDPAYVARRAKEVDPAKPSATKAVQPGLEKHETTHYSIVDQWGNAVSNTYTLNGSFGSGVVVEGAGFILNNEMDDFSAKPGAPNMFGVVGGAANAIAPGKRPLSSMTPTILTKDGRVAMVIGTPGGSRIFAWVFQVLANVYDHGLSLKAAQAAPRFHHQLLPQNVIFYERSGPPSADLKAALEARGYTWTESFSGDVEAIQVLGRTPVPEPDPRARGVGLVVK